MRRYEAKLLVALLGAGPSDSASLAQVSGVPRTSIYNVMDILAAKGVVEQVQGRGPVRWRCVGLEAFLDRLDADREEELRRHHLRNQTLRTALGTFASDLRRPAASRSGASQLATGALEQVAPVDRSEPSRRRTAVVKGEPSGLPGVPSMDEPVQDAKHSESSLTPRELAVYQRIRRSCARSPDRTVMAQFIGSSGACQRLVERGLIVMELAGIGAQGGRRYRYRLTADDPGERNPAG